jgi:hypothetical protein
MNFIVRILFSVLFLTTLFSCQKEVTPEDKPENNVVGTQEEYLLIGVDWILSDGRIYVENMDNGDKHYYDHFGNGQNLSVLDPFNGANVPFDTLVQDITTWNFGNSYFTLNGILNYTQNGTTTAVNVSGLEDGSARVITVLELTENKLTVRVGEGYGSDGVSNYHFFSTLTFITPGFTCTSCQPNALFGYTYGGTITTTTSTNDIVGTKWVVTKFYDGFANNYPNDTLDFFSGTQYRINNGTPINYTLSSIFGNNMSELTLYGFYTIGGDYSGMVPNSFVTNGEINSALFNDIFGTNNDKLVWMVRIQ